MELSNILRELNLTPVLVDVGSSLGPPSVWGAIASGCVYIGFDPDLRQLSNQEGGTFRRSVIMNEAVVGFGSAEAVEFFFTASPSCSSTLEPNEQSLAEWQFSSLFQVQRRAVVKATTLKSALDRLSLPGPHWVKVDSQGTDLRILKGLGDRLKSVLALDVEPGLIGAYQGEDLFGSLHQELVRNGFWLSDLNVLGTVRMCSSTRDRLGRSGIDALTLSLKTSPAWCEARYLRTLTALGANANTQEAEYGLLWIFAMLAGHAGFALDIVTEYQDRFPSGSLLIPMNEVALAAAVARTRRRHLIHRLAFLVPTRIKRFLRQTLEGLGAP